MSKKRNLKTRKRRQFNKKLKRSTKKGDRDVFSSDGLEIIREGKNIFLRNNRTPEQHKEYLERVKNSKPDHLEKIKNQIDEITQIFENYDKIKLLGALNYNHIINQFNPQDDGLSEVTLEYGLSFATSIKGNSPKAPTAEIINRLIDLLVTVRHDYNGYIMSESVTGKYSDLESNIRFRIILELLYVRGDGYPEHIYTIFKELFSGHDEFFEDKYGFTSSDLLYTILQLEDSFCCRLTLPNGLPHPASHARFVEWSKNKKKEEIINSKKHFIDLFGEENPDLIVEHTKIHSYRIDDLSSYNDLFKIRFRTDTQKKVVPTISQLFGDNSKFLDPKFKGMPLNNTTISTHPIIKIDENFYLFAFALPTRNIFYITENLIKSIDEKYYNEKYLGSSFQYSRDNYLENKAAKLFKKIIPDSNSYLNLKYKPGIKDENGQLIETELDLLIDSKNGNYLIEMKAGGLSSPSKRGAVKSLSGQLKEIVGYGAYQSFRALNYINESDDPIFYDSTGTKIHIDKGKKTYRITITLEHLGDLIAYMYDLKELGIIDKNVEFSWTCSVFDLIIFTEIIESETDFMNYLDKRIPLYKRSELNFQDEIDLLGHFLEHDLIFDEDMLKNLTNFQLNKYSSKIDEYFEKGGNKPTRKSKNSSKK
jgi:hypothetical protein